MIESCSFRRMIFCIIFFSIISAVVFYLESRMEESIDRGDVVLKKFIAWRGSDSTSVTNSPSNLTHPRNIPLNASQKHSGVTEPSSESYPPAASSILCYKDEPFTVIEECVRCSSFERDALRTEYCAESGYYDKLNCTLSGRLGLRSCYSRGDYASMRFNIMMASWMLMAVTSYVVVSWRRGLLDRRAYLRVQQQLAS
uniref:Protein JTB n=1 Tax=Parascaris univalens TaxID=6257 RepID=A0A915B8T9_PARUN